MNIIDKLNWRYATKKFDASKKLTNEQVDTILEAINLTPTSVGLQLQNVVLVENAETRAKLLPASMGQQQVVDASHLLVLCAETKLDDARIEKTLERMAEVRNVERSSLDKMKEMILFWTNKPAEELQTWMDHQVYIALGNLMTTCAVLDIDACPMEGFDPAQYTEILGLDEKGLKPVLVVPIGYRSEEDPYPMMKKVRKDINDFVVRM